MFDFLKIFRSKKKGLDNMDLDNKQESKNLTDDENLEAKYVESFELDDNVSVLNKPKYILKEDFNIMAQALPFPCNNVNVLDQTILKIRKSLITDPDEVDRYINLAYIEDFRVMEEAFVQQVQVNNPCGGDEPIVGEALLKEVILVGGVNYSVLLYDSVTKQKVYDGEVQASTAYSLYKIVPFNEEVTVDENNVTPIFSTTLTRLPELEDVIYYMYKVDGTVTLEVTP